MYRARTKLACKIARIDPPKFNEAVFNKNFKCAPSTVAGSARIFEIDDIVALSIYGSLLEEGMTAAGAGRIACNVRDEMKIHPEAKSITFIKGQSGFSLYTAGIISENLYPKPIERKAIQFSFDIEDYREHVAACLDQEASILGQDD